MVLEARLPALAARSISCIFCAGHFPAAGKPAVGGRHGAAHGAAFEPLALSAYLRSGLVTLEQFSSRGACARGRLSGCFHGGLRTIHAMAFFRFSCSQQPFIHGGRPPGAGVGAVPRGKNTERMHHLTGTCLRMGCLFALCTACLMGVSLRWTWTNRLQERGLRSVPSRVCTGGFDALFRCDGRRHAQGLRRADGLRAL